MQRIAARKSNLAETVRSPGGNLHANRLSALRSEPGMAGVLNNVPLRNALAGQGQDPLYKERCTTIRMQVVQPSPILRVQTHPQGLPLRVPEVPDSARATRIRSKTRSAQ
eukprot:5230994-Alexandrium_andersonii.AAC.1